MANSPARPEHRRRRSFIYHRLRTGGAVFEEFGEAVVALHFGDARAEEKQAPRLGLADATTLERTGFRGPKALPWLQSQGVQGLDASNAAFQQVGGGFALQLGPAEALILAGFRSDLCSRLERAYAAAPADGCFPVMRRDTSFHYIVTGSEAKDMMATLTAIDLRRDRFRSGCLAQTIIAEVPAIILRSDLGVTPAFHILGSSSSALYVWTCLEDALLHSGGRAGRTSRPAQP